MTTYRAAPQLHVGAQRPRHGGATPEGLVDRYMTRQSPRSSGRTPIAAIAQPMDPDAWWQLYVLGTHVRAAATMQQSHRQEDSLRPSSRDYRRAPPSRGSTASTRCSTASSMRSGVATPRHRSAPSTPGQRAAWVPPYLQLGAYPTFRPHNREAKPPVQRRDVGVQASPRAEAIRSAAPQVLLLATDDEVRKAHKDIKDKFTTRFSSMRKAFRLMDQDASGGITAEEFGVSMTANNLHTIRQPVLDRLFALMNCDGDGRIDYNEFCRMLNADDVFNMGNIAQKLDVQQAMAKRQLDDKRERQEAIAAKVGMSVEQYCEYFNISEIRV